MRCSSRTLTRAGQLALLGVILQACALEPGQPWGLVAPELEATLSLPEGRLDDGGRIRTVDDYRVVLTDLDLTVGSLVFIAGETTSLTFDPADPPAGYSLCHNGHCHAEDGRLVAYAEIAAGLAGAGGAGDVLLSLRGSPASLAAGDGALVGLGPCSNACAIDSPTELALARVTLTGLRVVGTVFDARVGEASRLDEGGQPFDIKADIEAEPLSLAVALGAAFGPGRDAGLKVSLALDVAPTLFDGIPWPEGGSAELSAAFATALGEALALRLGALSRFQP